MTRFLKKIWIVAHLGYRLLANRYEGARPGGSDRSILWGAQVQDARFDADAASLYEIRRKSRYFERNNAILNRIADLFEQFTVGANGLQISPASSDEAWNERAQAWWDEWGRFCDLTSRFAFGTIQSLIARSWLIDGEVFVLKTRGDSIPGQAARPRIQVIESHRVETPPDLTHQEGRTIIDGIEIDRRGRPVAYWVRDGVDASTWSRKPADTVIHVFEPSRPGQYRGVPFSASIINDLHDLDDLQILEMRAAKAHAKIANVLKKQAGELSDEDVLRRGATTTNEDAAGNEIDQRKIRHIQQATGGETLLLGTDEELTQLRSERPSVATQWYWDYLTSKICAGIGISKLLVFPVSLQGTVARAELDLANSFFRARSAVLSGFFKEIYVWVMDWARTNDITLADAPHDWRACYTCPPRAVNVDNGRNSSAIIAELEAGTRTYEDVYAERGLNWRRQLRQKAREAALIRQLSTEFAITPDEIAKRANLTIADLITREQAQAGAEQADDTYDTTRP